ncbi:MULTISPECIES: MarR family transcriptional regulator [Curvivirga]|uniref:MarR family transcriptional regulator n=1 Tax=Curvivirga TaxID=2856846 RepID=UPI0012BBED71|nr:MarR family transcriptional regulator [Curvivirga aplysinae]MTI10234.1 MarR family transcriptional regulator [Curvivirga aplysinae]
MSLNLTQNQVLSIWQGAITESVRKDTPDLSARQMAVLTTVYLTPMPHTVRGLAEKLNISKPAITRSLDRLSELGMVKRKPDENDRRSVNIQRTVKGSVYLHEFANMMMEAAKDAAE